MKILSNKEIAYLSTIGLEVFSYNSGNKKLYQVRIPLEHNDYQPVSSYMKDEEFQGWVNGFSEALELKKRKII